MTNAMSWHRTDLLEEDAPAVSPKEEMMKAFGVKFQVHKTIRNYGWIAVIALVLGILMASMYSIGYHNGKVVTRQVVTEQLTAEFNSRMQAYLDEQVAQNLVTGDASRQQAIASDARHLARIGQGVLNTYSGADLDDARKVMLCAVCRVLSGGEFAGTDSIEDAVTQENQWWGYSDGIAYTTDVYDVAVEVATIYENGDALPCSSNMVYAGWNGNEIVLRNQWKADATARYY